MPRQKNVVGDMYRILNEGAQYEKALLPGTTEVWYFKPEMGRDMMMGLEFIQEQLPGVYPEPYNLSKTHIMLGRVKSKDKDQLFHSLQGDFWSPQGEARDLIKAIGLNHTSISIGDILVINGSAFFVDSGAGWVNLGHVNRKD